MLYLFHKSSMNFFCLALVQSFLHFNLFFLHLFFVHVVLKVICLRFVLLLDGLDSLVLLLLELLSVFLIRQLLFIALLLKSVLVLHVFGAKLVALYAQFNLLLRLALLHSLFNIV